MGKNVLHSEQSEQDEAIRDSMKLAFDIMRNASLQLDRNQDAMKYANESLKIDVLRFHEKKNEKYELLLPQANTNEDDTNLGS